MDQVERKLHWSFWLPPVLAVVAVVLPPADLLKLAGTKVSLGLRGSRIEAESGLAECGLPPACRERILKTILLTHGPMTFPFRALFASWLMVVATGTVVSHRHEGSPGHAHGLGWTNLSVTSAPTELVQSHRHFVLLGIESGAVPDGSETGGATDPDRVSPAADLLAPLDGTPSGTAIDDLALSAPVLFPDRSVGTSTWTQTALIHLRPLGSHARSGILRL